MSKWSEYLRARYGKTPNETIASIIKRYLGEHAAQFDEFARFIIAAIDTEKLTGEQKKKLVRTALRGVAKFLTGRYDLNIPDWALNVIIDAIVAGMRIADEDKPPVEPPVEEPPVEEPPVVEPPEATLYDFEFSTEPNWSEYADGDQVWTDSPTAPTVWWVVENGHRPMLPTYIRTHYGQVSGGQLVVNG